MANFTMSMDKVWRNISGCREKLTDQDIKDIWEKMKPEKDLLLSLDNCTVDKDAFSDCPFQSITIVSGNNLQNLSFTDTGSKLKELGVGRFVDKNQDIPNVLGSKFPKLKKIELSDCPGLEKFVIKSGLKGKVEISQENCPNVKGDIEIKKDNKDTADQEDTGLENFIMNKNGVWKNRSKNTKVKLTKLDIDNMHKIQEKNKDQGPKPDKLLISLNNCILNEKTFSNCLFRSVTIVSGKDIEELHFEKTGSVLKRIGIGKFWDNKDVPNKWKGKFPKLKKIEANDCPGLKKLMIKSNLNVEVAIKGCDKSIYDAEIKARRNMDKYFVDDDELEDDKRNTSQRLMNNGYEVVRFLGAGSYGVVWECIKGENRYAAKVVCNPSHFDAIKEEQVISDSLSKKIEGDLWKKGLIVNEFVKATKDRGIFIAPLASKKDLYSRETQPATKDSSKTKGYKDFQSIEDIQNFMKSLLTSLKELHDSGFVHRDIKPENILVDKVVNENGKKKLTYAIGDFGLATHKDDSVGLSCQKGSPGFLPPETGYDADGNLKGSFKPYKSFEAAKKGDIFALGVTFFERLENELNKFDRKKALEAEDLIVTMLDDNPDKRPTVDEALRNPFFK